MDGGDGSVMSMLALLTKVGSGGHEPLSHGPHGVERCTNKT